MQSKNELKILHWDNRNAGDYASGVSFGRKLSRKILAYMGSGEVAVDNKVLSDLLTAWRTSYKEVDNPEIKIYLKGQKDGFLMGLSSFLVVAAYMNNCSLSDDNGYDPSIIRRPMGYRETR